jgi:hypothetical protein
VPPPAPDGTEIRKAGSSIQLKFKLIDADGIPINTATANAWFVKDPGTSYTKITPAFVFDGSGGHYKVNWQTPKLQGTYYINYIVDNPGATPNTRILIDPNNTFLDAAGKQATIKLTLVK